jgi:hypothetical protein
MNMYNHNFEGKYCYCDKPHEEDEDEPEENIKNIKNIKNETELKENKHVEGNDSAVKTTDLSEINNKNKKSLSENLINCEERENKNHNNKNHNHNNKSTHSDKPNNHHNPDSDKDDDKKLSDSTNKNFNTEEKQTRNGELDENNMDQCLICEDWFHLRHLDTDGIKEGCLICKICMKEKLSSLCNFENEKEKKLNDNIKIIQAPNNKVRKFSEAFPNDNIIYPNQDKKFKEENHSLCTLSEFPPVSLKPNNEIITKEFKDTYCDITEFLNSLCKCEKCKEIYSKNNLEFLLKEDFIRDWQNRELIQDVLDREAEEKTPENIDFISKLGSEDTLFNYPEIKNLPMEKVIDYILIDYLENRIEASNG